MKKFSQSECTTLEEIIVHRRDVRGNRFLDREISLEIINKILLAGIHAPSVGYSQPWEFVIVRDQNKKAAIKESFKVENAKASKVFNTERQALYQELKLEGIHEAPLNIAVFYKPSNKPVLGQNSMQEVGVYSVVCAIQNMWLMARALNIGLGWVSIVDPERVKEILNAPKQNTLVAYLCLGYVDKFYEKPELESKQWEKRKQLSDLVFMENY